MKITINQVKKQFNYKTIFQGVNFEMVNDHVYAIKGANGKGKSTLLKMIIGYSSVSDGQIIWYDEDKVLDTSLYKNHYSICTPYMELIEEFTIEEMIRFYFSSWNWSPSNEELEKTLIQFNLLDYLQTHISVASSGMKQKTKLLLALLSPANVILLDEPTSNLDTESTIAYRKLLEAKKNNKLIIIATNQEVDLPEEFITLDLNSY